MFKIVTKKISVNKLMEIEAPLVARKHSQGNLSSFVSVKTRKNSLTIADSDKEKALLQSSSRK